MKEKYILVEVIERDISEPSYFDSHEEAFNEMCDRFADCFNTDVASVKESYLNGEEYEDNACVLENSAFCESMGHDNVDWKIFRIE